MKKLFLYISFCFIIIVILEYARQGWIEDLSMQQANYSHNKSPTYLISYADGPEYFYRNQNAMAHYALNKNIDFILNYRKSHIDESFLKQNKEIFREKIGGGMWLWKPYIILETMKHAKEDAIILYLDAAFKIKKPLNELFIQLDENNIILVQDHDRKNGAYVKGDSFALLDCTSEECRYGPHITSAAILIKNNRESRIFIERWLHAMQNVEILSNQDYHVKENYPEYKWHHFDQSVLSLIYFKNQNKVKVISWDELSNYMSWFHRKPSKSSPIKDYYSLYGTDPIVNFNKQGKNLPSTSLLNLPPIVYIRNLILNHNN